MTFLQNSTPCSGWESEKQIETGVLKSQRNCGAILSKNNLGLKFHSNHPDCSVVLVLNLVSRTMYKTAKPDIGVAENYLEGVIPR
jgi:hypothetical protein